MKRIFLILLALAPVAGSAQEITINGVTWAAHNCGYAEFGPYGALYQFDKGKAWPTTGDIASWDASEPAGLSDA